MDLRALHFSDQQHVDAAIKNESGLVGGAGLKEQKPSAEWTLLQAVLLCLVILYLNTQNVVTRTDYLQNNLKPTYCWHNKSEEESNYR